MVPARLVAWTELPRLPNGKVDRGRLAQVDLEPEAPAAPRPDGSVLDERTEALVSLWRGLLGVDEVGPDDNFFRLGGHSLLAAEMTVALERDLGVRLSPAEVFQHPTIAELARRIGERRTPGAPTYAHLFPIQPGGHGAPFLFHIPHVFADLVAARFRGERPVVRAARAWACAPRATGAAGPPCATWGETWPRKILDRFPDERYLMAGYSFGASMAVETARQLEDRGATVDRLYLIAPMPLDLYHLGPIPLQIDALRRPLAEHSRRELLVAWLRSNHPLTRRPYARLWQRIGIGVWRRWLCTLGRLRACAGRPRTPRILHADVRLERFRLHARYRPRSVRAPTVLFNPREPATDAAATWRPVFQGPFTVIETSDPHLGPSSVEATGRSILEALDRAGA